MKRLAIVALAVGCAMMVGCAGYPEYLAKSDKPNLMSTTESRYDVQNYAVLGIVTAEVHSVNVLGIYAAGEDGQAALMREGVKRYPNLTGLKDICAVKSWQAILAPVYCHVKTTYMGVAVQQK